MLLLLLLERMNNESPFPSSPADNPLGESAQRSEQRDTQAYQRGRSGCSVRLRRIGVRRRQGSEDRLAIIQRDRMDQLHRRRRVLQSCRRRVDVSSARCRLRLDCLQVHDEMVRRMKVLARFASAFAFDVVDADGDETVGIERTVSLRVCVRARLGRVQALPVLKIRADLEQKRVKLGKTCKARTTGEGVNRTEQLEKQATSKRGLGEVPHNEYNGREDSD